MTTIIMMVNVTPQLCSLWMTFQMQGNIFNILSVILSFVFNIYISLCNIQSQMKAKFTVDDHRHYLFTPCILTEWVLSLLRYDLTAGNNYYDTSFIYYIACLKS